MPPTPPEPTAASILRAAAEALRLSPGDPSTGAERMFIAVATEIGCPEGTYAEVRAALIKIVESESR
jgi:hypothetical protein